LIDLPIVPAKRLEESKAAITSCEIEQPVERLLYLANVSATAGNNRIDDRFVNHDSSLLKLFEFMS
jgi:hypothetical protein